MAVGFQEEGRWMYTGGEDGTVKIWDLRMKNLLCQRIFQAGNVVNSVKLHPNQQEVLVGDAAGNIHIWNLSSEWHQSIAPENDASIQHVDVDISGNMIAAITNKGTCYTCSFKGRNPEDWSLLNLFKPDANIEKIAAHQKYGLKCKFSPDSKMLVTTSADNTAKLWHTKTNAFISVSFHQLHVISLET